MPADDDLIEAAPCPSCRSPLTVAVSDLGHLVECPGCGTQFRARRPGATSPSPPPPPARREERREDPDEFDDRPRRSSGRTSGRTSGRDRGFGREPERDRDSDDRYEDRRRRERPGSVTALAVMHFVYAGLLLLCGVFGGLFLAFGAELIQGLGGPEPNWAMELLVLVSYFATGLVALFAGILTLQRKGFGLSMAAIGLACVSLLLGLVNAVMNIQADDEPAEPGEEVGMVCGFAILVLFWLGYIITAGILLSKAGRHFR